MVRVDEVSLSELTTCFSCVRISLPIQQGPYFRESPESRRNRIPQNSQIFSSKARPTREECRLSYSAMNVKWLKVWPTFLFLSLQIFHDFFNSGDVRHC